MNVESQHQERSFRWHLLVFSLFTPLLLLAGLWLLGGSAGAELLAPAAAQISGQVVEPDGDPITDTAWVCLKHVHPDGGIDWEVCTDTVASGVFTLTEMIPSDLFNHQVFVVQAFPPEESAYFQSLPKPSPVSDNSFVGNVGPVTLTHASFAGMVYEPDGTTPASGGWVSVIKNDQWEVAQGDYGVDGSYEIGGVPLGRFKLMAYPPPDSLWWWSEPEPVTVPLGSQYDPNATQPYSLTLQEPSVTGTVVYSDGSPVTWVMSGTEIMGQAWARAVRHDGAVDVERPTASSGQFGLRMEAGEYAIWAEPRGVLAMTYTKAVPRHQFVGPGSLQFPIFEPFTLTYPSVVGQIYDPAGDPVTECLTVWLKNMDGKEVAWDWACDGMFKLGGVPVGDYWLGADGIPEMRLFPPKRQMVWVGPGTQYDPDDTQTMPITMTKEQLEVSVENPAGDPYVGHVSLWNDKGFEAHAEAMPGKPALFGNLEPGDYWIQAWPMEHDIPMLANSRELLVTIFPDAAPISHVLRLRRSTVTGTVETPEGDPLPQAFDWDGNPVPHPAEIEVHNTSWTFDLWAVTNVTGEFGLALPPDDYELLARPLHSLENQYTKSSLRQFTAPMPGDPPLDLGYIRLTYPRVVGWVLDPMGNRVATSVNVWSDDGSYYDWDDTHPPEKPFRLGGMPEDHTYHVQADPPWDNPMGYGSSNIVSFDVPPTATEQITLYLNMANFVGEVLMPEDFNRCPGCPVSGVEVRIRDAAWNWEHWAGTGMDGRFTFSGLMTDTEYILDFFLPPELQRDWVSPASDAFTLTSPTEQVTGTYHLRPAIRPKQIVGQVRNQDGDLIDDAMVYAEHEDSARFAETRVDASGHYTFNLVGGLWRVGTYPDAPDAGWWFDPAWEEWVVFSHTVDVEQRTVPLTVTEEVFFKVTGVVTTPDGSEIPSHTVGVDLCTDEGECFGAPVAPDGKFTAHVLPGAYELWVWLDPNQIGLLPPLNNGFPIFVEEDIALEDPIYLRPQTERPARVQGRVVITPTGLGLSGVTVEAWSDAGVWNETDTITRGAYTLELAPGHWNGGPVLTEEQEENYLLLPPRRRDGYLRPGEVITGVNFFLRRRDATIQGKLVDEGGDVITDTDTTIFAEVCPPDPNRPCHFVDEDEAQGGSFELNVVGGMTYTLSADVHSGGYMLADALAVPIQFGETITGQNLTLLEASNEIYGCLENPDGTCVDAEAGVFASSPDGDWVDDYLGPGKSDYSLWVTEGITWFLDFWVDPHSGYIADPTYAGEEVFFSANNQSTHRDLPVLPLDTYITGEVRKAGVITPLRHVMVFAEGSFTKTLNGKVVTRTLYFEAKTDASGQYTMPVLPGEYEVGAYLPPGLREDFLRPPLQQWASMHDNPVDLVFRPRPMGDEVVEICGSLSVSPTGALTGDLEIPVYGWAHDGNTAEVTGTLEAGYCMEVVTGTTWHLWAAYEDTVNNAYYVSDEVPRIVGSGGNPPDVDLTLERQPYDLPDPLCWEFDPSQSKRLNLPARGDLFEPLVEIRAGTMPVTDTVRVCATPKVALPDGHYLIGFGYELNAYDSQDNLITEDFNKKVRLIFYFNEDALGDAEAEDLQMVYYSTVRQEWVALEDMFVDAEDMFATGKVDHFSRFGAMSPPPEEEAAVGDEYKIYLPLVMRNTG